MGPFDPSPIEEKQYLIEDDHEGQYHLLGRTRWQPGYAVVIFLLCLSNAVTFAITSSTSQKPIPADTGGLYANLDLSRSRTVQFEPFLMNGTRYTAAASPEVDLAWSDLGVEYQTFLVPPSQASRYGISPDHALIPGDAPGADGAEGYAVDMEVLHQLHCLNLLRKSTFYNYPRYTSSPMNATRAARAFLDPSDIVEAHVNHCIDALRQRIMCAADTEVSAYWWLDRNGRTISDFAVTRQCRDFNAVRTWAEKRQIKEFNGTGYVLKTPAGAKLHGELMAAHSGSELHGSG